MCQTEERDRIVAGAEIFFGESVVQYLADLSDEYFLDDRMAEGILLGREYHDSRGFYIVVSGVASLNKPCNGRVGWFISRPEVGSISEDDVRRAGECVGAPRFCIFAIDSSNGTIAMYSVNGGIVRKSPSMMLENF